MKKILSILAAALTVICAVSCFGDNESYFTPAPFYVSVMVQNPDGANLLDTTTVHNWADSTFSLVYRGKTYTCEDAPEMSVSDMKYGKYDTYSSYDGKYYRLLALGMFDGVEEIDDDIVFYWPDNSTDTMHLRNKGTWASSGKGFTSLERWIQLNGEDVLTSIVLITKQPEGEKPAE